MEVLIMVKYASKMPADLLVALLPKMLTASSFSISWAGKYFGKGSKLFPVANRRLRRDAGAGAAGV